jgi:hypothetical protein
MGNLLGMSLVPVQWLPIEVSKKLANDAEREFVRQSWMLAKSNPSVWRTFVEAFDRLTVFELERTNGATSESLAVNMGMGRQMVRLRNDFRDIEDRARKLGVA